MFTKLPIDLDLDMSLKLIVQEAISKMVCEKLSLIDEIFLSSVEYLPTYKKNKNDNKELNNLYIRLITDYNFKVITQKEILESGATWEEVVEFFLFSGSRKITTQEFFNTD